MKGAGWSASIPAAWSAKGRAGARESRAWVCGTARCWESPGNPNPPPAHEPDPQPSNEAGGLSLAPHETAGRASRPAAKGPPGRHHGIAPAAFTSPLPPPSSLFSLPAAPLAPGGAPLQPFSPLPCWWGAGCCVSRVGWCGAMCISTRGIAVPLRRAVTVGLGGAGVPSSFGVTWTLFCSPGFKRIAWRRAKA